jgi:Cu/Ag efflux pump CusA
VLTIIGYSTNDTVVIYDRVRENLRRYKAMPLPELIDRSINETLARTVMTSLTTLLVLIALVVAGGPVIRDFTIAMIWGVSSAPTPRSTSLRRWCSISTSGVSPCRNQLKRAKDDAAAMRTMEGDISL